MSLPKLNDGEYPCPICSRTGKVSVTTRNKVDKDHYVIERSLIECVYCAGSGKIGGYYVLPEPSIVYNAYRYPKMRGFKNKVTVRVESPTRFYRDLAILMLAGLVLFAVVLFAVHTMNTNGSFTMLDLTRFLISTQ